MCEHVLASFKLKSPDEVINDNFYIISDIDREFLISYIEQKNQFYFQKLNEKISTILLEQEIDKDKLARDVCKLQKEIQHEWESNFSFDKYRFSEDMLVIHRQALEFSIVYDS